MSFDDIFSEENRQKVNAWRRKEAACYETDLDWQLCLQRAHSQAIRNFLENHGGARDEFLFWLSGNGIYAIDGERAPELKEFETSDFLKPETVKALLSTEDFATYARVLAIRKEAGCYEPA